MAVDPLRRPDSLSPPDSDAAWMLGAAAFFGLVVLFFVVMAILNGSL